MQIRAADLTDLASLEALFDEVDTLHRELLPDRFRAPAGPARSAQHLREQIDGPLTTLLLAEDAGAPLGLVHVLLRDAPDLPLFVPRRIAIVDNLVVAATARRTGVGRALMAAAHTWARERGAAAIELTVYAANDQATAFYRALGYQVLAHRLARDL